QIVRYCVLEQQAKQAADAVIGVRSLIQAFAECSAVYILAVGMLWRSAMDSTIELGAGDLQYQYLTLKVVMPIISNLAGIRQLFINNVYPIQEVYDKAHMEAEAPAHVENSELTADWPEHGQVEFRNYSMRFTAKQDRALADISLQIKSGEKIGVVGRTGAGKTSLSLGLFRMIEAESGSILIDGVDIAQVGLHDLRSRLGIVSQDPALFHGTLRFNLDPLQRHCDRKLWEAVEAGGIAEM
ncbi:Canalicular multispecific organic anion transporter 2, partial [Linderina pennispora]